MKAEEPITEYNLLDPNGTYTYWDYLRWQFSERIELIKGKLFKMSPTPNVVHQRISLHLTKSVISYFETKPCAVFVAPFDVRLPIPKANKDTTVVQPDLCIICDESKLDKQGCNGAPDLVVEILSPGNSTHELRTKFQLYQESGVQEYWIVQPSARTVLVYTLRNETYVGLRPFIEDMYIESPLFPELKVEVNDLFYGIPVQE